MKFLRKNWGNLLLILLIAVVMIPQTRFPIQVFLQRTFAGNPKPIDEAKIDVLADYNWNMLGLDGSVVDFSESRGTVTIVNFWATWCPPCIAELPSFRELYLKRGEEVDFYFVSPEDVSVVEEFLNRKKYNLPVYLERESPPELLSASALPTTFVISKSGEIIMQHTGAANWDNPKFVSLLDDLISE